MKKGTYPLENKRYYKSSNYDDDLGFIVTHYYQEKNNDFLHVLFCEKRDIVYINNIILSDVGAPKIDDLSKTTKEEFYTVLNKAIEKLELKKIIYEN